MRFESEPAPDRKGFSRSQRDAILMRQSFEGADGVRVAVCDNEGCGAHLASLNASGNWDKLRKYDFDHGLARGLYGKTSLANGRAICSGGRDTCHGEKSADDVARMAKAERQGGRSGQWARQVERKLSGKKPLIQSRPFERPRP